GGGRGGGRLAGAAEEALVFDAEGDEGTDTLVVVVHDGFADVVGEGAVARVAVLAHAAETGDLAALGEADGAVGILADEVTDDAGVAFFHYGQVFLAREDALVDALGEGVNE